MTHAVQNGTLRDRLKAGLAIPAHPLALDDHGAFDEQSQRALTRYYLASGAGGLAVGVHTTQFAIREPKRGLLEPVLALAADTALNSPDRDGTHVMVAGICGKTSQAVGEARLARELGYDVGLLSPGGLKALSESQLLEHASEVATEIPIFGFYLQPAVGGRFLSYSFWRSFLEIENVVAIKVAPFNRYQTVDVVRALVDSGRSDDVSLYTGNDDSIVADLVSRYAFARDENAKPMSFAGGLLGHWACWTSVAVRHLRRCTAARKAGGVSTDLIELGHQVTDANAALFDAANQYAGCIAGIHHVLVEQGLMRSMRCLDPCETLSPGQQDQIDRVSIAYPHLVDDDFVRENLDAWRR